MIEARLRKIIFVLMLIFGINAVAAPANLTILSRVYVDGDTIYLKDIVDASEIPETLKSKIDAIVIGDSPKEGEVRNFSSYAISEIIRYNLKADMIHVRLKIPSIIKISRRSANLTAEEVKSRMTEWIQQTCAPCDVEVTAVRLQKTEKLDPNVVWQISNPHLIPRGNFNITLDLYKDKNFFKKVYVQGNVRIVKEVPIAKRNLRFGERFQQDDVLFAKKDITFNKEIIPTTEQIVGSEVAGNVSSNQIIWQRNIKKKLAVARGSPVQVTVQDQGWRIHLSGISQEGGGIGDTIKILNPATKKVIVGVVKDNGHVEVR